MQPAWRVPVRQPVDGGMGDLVREQTVELSTRWWRSADGQADLAVEESGDPRVDARDVLEVLALVEDRGHAGARPRAELGADAIPRRLQSDQHGARRFGLGRRTGLHDEVRRDGAMETGFRLTLALDLIHHAT